MNQTEHTDHVVARLQSRLEAARKAGFQIRMEILDGQQATWCEIAGKPTLFVDLSQTASEQLQQLDEALQAYGDKSRDRHQSPDPSIAGEPKRAA